MYTNLNFVFKSLNICQIHERHFVCHFAQVCNGNAKFKLNAYGIDKIFSFFQTNIPVTYISHQVQVTKGMKM